MDQFRSERSSHGHGRGSGGDDDAIIVKDEKRSDESSVGGDDEDNPPKQEASIEEPSMTKTEKFVPETVPICASSTKKEEVDELESAKAEMGEVIEENQRLKMCLNRILNDYKTLQVQFHSIVQQDQTKNPPNNNNNKANDDSDNNSHQKMLLEESELVSLSLGRLPSNPARSDEKANKVSKPLLKEEEECKEEGLELGLECKFETSKSESTTEHLPNNNNNPISPANSCEAPKEEEAGETWPPSKVLKTSTTRDGGGGEDEVSQHNPAKKARVCVRARCDTPTMNDGCQWRKYGQKISKGNPCPRAYYRCTIAPSCPVRKQVQRCAQDMSILITTYEGTHNHPLPLSATAMASTTSAAASMLLSGSSSSTSHHSSSSIPSSISTTPSPNNNNLLHHHHHGMNFFLSDGSKSRQFYLSHPSLSSSPSHPTITLDLTTSSNPSSSSSSAPFPRFNTNFNNKYPSSTSLNFSNNNNNPSESNAISWTNNNGFLTYNNNNNRNILSTMNLGRSSQQIENFYHSFMQRNNNNNNNVPISSHQNSLPDTIAAATKVITADPNFQSALAAALTSIISTQQGNNQSSVGENMGQKMKWGEIFQAANNNSSALPSSSKANNNIGCASSFLNKAAPANNNNNNNTQTGNNNLVFLQPPSLPFSGTKSASGSPGDNRDNTN